MEWTAVTIGWILLGVFQLIIAIYILSLYHKDKDKKKIMFSISFIILSFSYIYTSTPLNDPLSEPLYLHNIQYWTYIPLLISFFIAINQRFMGKTRFDSLFYIFIVSILSSFVFSLFLPFTVDDLFLTVTVFVAIEAISIQLFQTLHLKNLSDSLLALAMINFTVGGLFLALFLNMGISLFALFSANIFTVMFFQFPFVSTFGEEDSVVNYFSIKKQLDSTKAVLAEREETFYTLFNQMADPVMILDKKGTFLELTDKVKEFTGYEKEEILGQNFLRTKLLTPKSKTVCVANLMKRMAGMDVRPYEVEATTKDGRIIPFEVNAQRIMYKGEKADLVVFRDITERKKTQAKLRESERKLTTLSANLPGMAYRCANDERWTMKFVSNGCYNLTGYQDKELLDNSMISYADLIYPDDKDYVWKTVETKVNNHQPFEMTYRIITKNGIEKWVWEQGIGVYSDDGILLDLEGFISDITEVKEAEKKLQKLHEKSLFLSDSASQLQKISDNNEIFSYMGEKIKAVAPHSLITISSYDQEQKKFNIQKTLGTPELFESITNVLKINLNNHSPTIKNTFIWQYLQEGRLKKLTDSEFKDVLQVNYPHGSYTLSRALINTQEVYTMGLKDEDTIFGSVVIAAYKGHTVENHDLIEAFINQAAVALQRNQAMKHLSLMNKDLEQKVQQRTEEIQRLLKQKDEFIHQLGHDLKNPLGPAISLLPLIEKRLQGPKDLEMVYVVRRNIEYMRNLVQKTLELARLNSPNTQFQLEQHSLSMILEKVLSNNRFLLEDKRISIQKHIPLGLWVYADKLRVEELFTNLLNNAVKYSPDGGIVEITAKTNGEHVLVSVYDQGIGMTQEQLGHIFDEFYKADESRHDFDSSGLGMPICKRIIEKHGGRIWAESKGLHKGSTFYFTLPMQKDTSNKEIKDDLAPVSDYKDVSSRVDDLITIN